MISIKNRFSKLSKPNLSDSIDIKEKFNLDSVIKLDYNENHYGASPKITEKIFSNKHYHEYPRWSNPDLRIILEKKYKLPNDYFYVSNGSDAILDNIPELFTSVTANQNVILPNLTYKRIEQTCIVKNIQMKQVVVDENGFIDLDDILKLIDKNTAVIYIVNPNMPTGTFHDQQRIFDFLNKIRSDILVVFDHAYIEFAIGLEETRKFNKKLIDKFDNVLITQTFSKLYGLASFRIGYAISRPYILDVFKSAAQYLPLSHYAELAAQIALNDDQYYEKIIKKINNEKNYFYQEFNKLGIKYLKSSGNFIYVKWENTEEIVELWNWLIKNFGIIIRIIANRGFRISIGVEAENKLVVQGFKKFLNDKGR